MTTRTDRFQQWESLLHTRTKRQRHAEFLVHGVRPISEAQAHGWTIRVLLHAGAATSRWAQELLGSGVAQEIVQLPEELLREFSEKDTDLPEVIAVVVMRPDDLDRIAVGPNDIVLVLDRPISPGNVGSLLRSADAFGVDGVIVAGHAADIYDPPCVRASRGSLFAVPAIRVDAPSKIVEWLQQGRRIHIVGTSEEATTTLWVHDFTGLTALIVGNETTGMSTFLASSCDSVVHIPMTGSASSFNAAVAESITLYEVTRQRSS